jgi:hypothetical protein
MEESQARILRDRAQSDMFLDIPVWKYAKKERKEDRR